MADEPEDNGPARTVFAPAGGVPAPDEPSAPKAPEPAADTAAEDAWFAGETPAPPTEPAPEEAPPAPRKPRRGRKAPEAAEATILQSGTSPPSGGSPVSRPPVSTSPSGMTAGFDSLAPRGSQGGRVSVGAVLNHIYEVRRFLARGGMGEVYEGVNVNSDERVAIKVILPHLVADPNVQAMFRKEARTLTRLSHPALVQYRVLATEPQLGVLYIVTEFVDGVGLDQVIGDVRPSQTELLGLMRRLAEGLRVAHDLGAIHRDISPDNILLPGGRLQEATIIDFGIAKDLDASHATIVGDGFAGKLGYVAPEQLGAFDREVGPWTDVYSLALVILALATGKSVDMGSTLFDAVHRRHTGPDLTQLPANLKPLFDRMLVPDPKQRLRSMDEVLREIADINQSLEGVSLRPRDGKSAPRGGGASAAAAGVAGAAPPKPPKPPQPPGGGLSRPSTPLIIAGAVGAVVLAGGALALMLTQKHSSSDKGGVVAAGAGANDIERGLSSVRCAWLQAVDGPPVTALKGAAQSGFEGPASQRFPGAGTRQVLSLEGQSCGLLEAVRPLAAPALAGAEWVKAITSTGDFTPARRPECGDDPNQALALAEIDASVRSGEDMALYLLRPGGVVEPIFRGRAQLSSRSGAMASLTSLGSDRFRVGVCNGRPGPYGLLAVRGQGPFTAPDDASGKPIADRLAADAKAKGWRTQMDWYAVLPSGSAVAAAPSAAPPAQSASAQAASTQTASTRGRNATRPAPTRTTRAARPPREEVAETAPPPRKSRSDALRARYPGRDSGGQDRNAPRATNCVLLGTC